MRLLGFVAHPLTIVAHILGQALAPRHDLSLAPSSCCALGFTGGLPANLDGISIIALLISTATGLRSLA